MTWHQIVSKMMRFGFEQDAEFDKLCGSNSYEVEKVEEVEEVEVKEEGCGTGCGCGTGTACGDSCEDENCKSDLTITYDSTAEEDTE
ncbi:hypothetical protein, partial [Pseudomonas bubulae]|uniref:hypothetical protein n=1 Tax=Pseudomonas bubulae TaxID=2316085 RepID=UPI002B1E173B